MGSKKKYENTPSLRSAKIGDRLVDKKSLIEEPKTVGDEMKKMLRMRA